MKIRNGFVSNSSSTAFILDRRKLDVATLHKIESLPDMDLWNRCTGSCSNVESFLNGRADYNARYGWADSFAVWIEQWMDKLGHKNIVLCRESDEGMGGEFEDVGLSYDQISNLAESEMEYH